MTATQSTTRDVLQSIQENHPSWPQSNRHDSWALIWDAAVYAGHWFEHDEHNDLEEAILNYPLDPDKFEYGAARWHRNTKAPESMLRAQLIRFCKGFEHEKQLHTYLDNNPELVQKLGLDKLPSRSAFWKSWNKHIRRDEARVSIRIIANVFIKAARKHNVSAPPRAFQPKFDAEKLSNPDPENPSIRDHTETATEEVWKEIKPYVNQSYSLGRSDNASVPESTWWEAHAFLGPREDEYAESGLDNFRAESNRDEAHCGRYHRDTLRAMDVEDARQSHRQATKKIINEARQKGELDRKTIASLDITKSNPLSYMKNVEGWDPDPKKCNVSEDWILGYDDSDMGEDPDINYYFQWAGIRTVGLSHPAILDGIPVYRGMPRYEIVDELLKHSKHMVNIDILLMDREFDNDKVRAVCLKHGVQFFTPERMHASERATCTRLRQQRKMVKVEEKTVDVSDEFLDEILGDERDDMTEPEIEDMLTYNRVYVPAKDPEMWASQIEDIETDDSGREESEEEPPEEDERPNVRAELRNDFANTVLGEDPEDLADEGHPMFGQEVVKEIKAEEEKRPTRAQVGNRKDKQLYALFATNHQDLPTEFDEDDREEEKVDEVESFLERYGHRWDIEEGWKYLNTFRVGTKSRDEVYRFFNFIYSATLYNVWKIVDLIVKLSFHDDPPEGSFVPRHLFLIFAKKYFGKGPPA